MICTCSYEVDIFAQVLRVPEDLVESYEFCSENLRLTAHEYFPDVYSSYTFDD